MNHKNLNLLIGLPLVGLSSLLALLLVHSAFTETNLGSTIGIESRLIGTGKKLQMKHLEFATLSRQQKTREKARSLPTVGPLAVALGTRNYQSTAIKTNRSTRSRQTVLLSRGSLESTYSTIGTKRYEVALNPVVTASSNSILWAGNLIKE